MNPEAVRRDLETLFRDAGKEHHRAFLATNGDDPDWPFWYAEFLEPRLNDLLGTRWDSGAIALFLRRVESERQSTTQDGDWPQFYADWFLHRLNQTQD